MENCRRNRLPRATVSVPSPSLLHKQARQRPPRTASPRALPFRFTLTERLQQPCATRKPGSTQCNGYGAQSGEPSLELGNPLFLQSTRILCPRVPPCTSSASSRRSRGAWRHLDSSFGQQVPFSFIPLSHLRMRRGGARCAARRSSRRSAGCAWVASSPRTSPWGSSKSTNGSVRTSLQHTRPCEATSILRQTYRSRAPLANGARRMVSQQVRRLYREKENI